MKKIVRMLLLLVVLGSSNVIAVAQIDGPDPIPTCSPADPNCTPPGR